MEQGEPPNPEPVAQAKRAARRAAAAALAGVPGAARAAAGGRVADRLLALLASVGRPDVLAYAATPRELPTAEAVDALLAAGHRVAVPAITGPRRMRGRVLGPRGLRGLAPGPLGVPAPPAADPADPEAWMDQPAVVLVPGLAFDPRTGGRLGRGGGFYDAYLGSQPRVLSIGLCFDEQLRPGLPVEPHDRAVGVLLTPSRTIHPAPPGRP